MYDNQFVEALADFVTGEISVEAFQECVDETLADLRETRQPSEEKSRLSKLDLVLHEVRENARDRFDAYALALMMLQHALREPYPVDNRLSETSYKHFPLAASRRASVRPEFDSESGEPTEHYDVPLVESRA